MDGDLKSSESSDEDLELTDDEEYVKRHKPYEECEVKRYNIGLLGHKNAESKQLVHPTVKAEPLFKVEQTQKEVPLLPMIQESKTEFIQIKPLLSKRKKHSTTNQQLFE